MDFSENPDHQAIREGVGTVVSTSRTLDLPGTEKVLAASASWLHSAEHLALVASLRDTCAWLDAPEHRQLACDWLAEALQVERSCLEPSLLGVPEALGGLDHELACALGGPRGSPAARVRLLHIGAPPRTRTALRAGRPLAP